MKRLIASALLIVALTACGGGGTNPPPPAPTLVITTKTVPTAVVGQPHSVQLTASGVCTWSEAGTLPSGLTLSTTGLISGTPKESGNFSIEVTCAGN